MPDIYPGTDLAKPPPLHTLRKGSEQARQALIKYGRDNPFVILPGQRKARRVPRHELAATIELVTEHKPPWRQVELTELTGAAALLAKAAVAAGCEVAAKAAGKAVCVGVRRPSVRAYWVGGRSVGVLVDGHKTTVAAAKAALYDSTERA